MKKNREDSWIGDTPIWIYDKIKNWGKCTHSVGGLIPMNEDEEWDRLRDTLERYGVNMNKGGLMFCIKWANLFLDASCPIAEEIRYHPIGLTDDLVYMCSELIKGMSKEDIIDNTSKLRKEVSEGMESQILLKIKDKIAP